MSSPEPTSPPHYPPLTYYVSKSGAFGVYNQSTNASPMRTAVEIEQIYAEQDMINVIGQAVRSITYTSIEGQPQQKLLHIKHSFLPSSNIKGGFAFNAALYTPTLRLPLTSSVASGWGDFAALLTPCSNVRVTPISEDLNMVELNMCIL